MQNISYRLFDLHNKSTEWLRDFLATNIAPFLSDIMSKQKVLTKRHGTWPNNL